MGTVINAVAIVVAGIVGTVIGDRLPGRMRQTVVAGLGVISLLIGLQMALKTQHLLIVLGSVVLGAVVGEVLDLDARMESLGRWLERRVQGLGFVGSGASEEGSFSGGFSRGFVVASLMFCIGPMAIMGSIQDGLTGDYEILAVKSMLDGFASIAFASTLGIGVAFSALPVLLYQGGLTLGAGWLKSLLTEAMVTEMTATGGLLIVAMALQILEVRRIRVANLLPAIVLAPVGVAVLGGWL